MSPGSGRPVAGLRQGLYELMVQFAVYTGLRWGELAALTADRVSQEARVVVVDRKVIEVGGHDQETQYLPAV